MTEIIPVILVKNQQEAEARIHIMNGHAEWMQIDVVDGIFAPNTAWGDPDALAAIPTAIRFEADLMVVHPEAIVKKWLTAAPKVGRIYFHQEVAGNRAHAIIDAIKKTGVEAGMSLNPKTSHETLYSFAQKLDAVLFLGVEPGFSGQEFDERIIEKVAAFHAKFSNLPIEVDGGITQGVAQRLAHAGASRLAASTAIFGQSDPLAALEVLRRDVNL